MSQNWAGPLFGGKWQVERPPRPVTPRPPVRRPRPAICGGRPRATPGFRPEFAVAPGEGLVELNLFTLASSRSFCAPPAFQKNTAALPSGMSAQQKQSITMSDQATSGESPATPETAPAAAPAAAPSGDPRPIGSFGNARGSGLSRGKRATPPPSAPAATASDPGSYKPTAVEVITPQREYTNPFASETPASTPVINEPVSQPAAPVRTPAASAPAPASEPVAARGSEMFPFTPTAGNEPKPSSPQPEPESASSRAEIKILPPAEAKRPSVSWGDGTHDEDTRPQRDQRSTFRPERRGDGRPAESREQKPFQPRDNNGFSSQPREPREPRREGGYEPRGARPRDPVPARAPEPAPASGGFFGWLKNLFGGKPAEPQKPQTEQREGQYREGDQRRNRGGRGRGGYQNDNRGPRNYQPRDPRDEAPGDSKGYQNGDSPAQGSGERRYEGGGGGRRRRRGGRGRYRDDRGGPQSEGQQGGGAI